MESYTLSDLRQSIEEYNIAMFYEKKKKKTRYSLEEVKVT